MRLNQLMIESGIYIRWWIKKMSFTTISWAPCCMWLPNFPDWPHVLLFNFCLVWLLASCWCFSHITTESNWKRAKWSCYRQHSSALCKHFLENKLSCKPTRYAKHCIIREGLTSIRVLFFVLLHYLSDACLSIFVIFYTR